MNHHRSKKQLGNQL
ncbi:hypothetical protein EJF18_50691 [Clavispora lusitaniae]|uniref:Uncharacterized protein n=1 Tax=Clavispora lusitaniae TaxID=36911 RepID=A0ACD0WPK8_CLALS|nr:hypothetical protein EJF14_50691 [Clavispora lusitaniae]QFZ35112.1 hypothetical protein EJF16_50691 [Clavispora lusitaniae]QFZ40797.1 hypothetical protein EJF15_50691 [Clavispora lusitaniae]QFZ46477.1 hypothetical protein EJF18_50691 [Clavispora lusitaniae]QFZ52139.1 hypothetical protein EJF17_50691 [Clavispora lusitaniae]